MGTDVIVVGGGVIGASVALELARAGREVVVLEQAGGIGLGSTSASSAIVRFNYSTEAGVATAWESHHHWLDWREHLGCDVGAVARFERTGLAMLDVDLAPRSASLPLFDAVGVPYEQWDAADLRARIPGIDPGRYWPPRRLDDDGFWADATGELGAVFTPDAGYVVDPQLAAQNLAAAASHFGARIRLRTTVTAVEQDEGRVTGVRLADGGRLECAALVNAAGPWSSGLNALAGVGSEFTIGVRPLRQEVAHVTAPPGFAASGITVADLDLGIYLRAEAGGGLLVGGTEPACDPLEWLDGPAANRPHPTLQVLDAQVTRAARRLTDLGVPGRPRGIVGVYDVTDDWAPIYDRTDLDGYYVAIGTSGNQFKNAPLVGQFLAAIIERVEAGHDHDRHPVRVPAPRCGMEIDLGAFSRRRPRNLASSGTVMG